MTQWHHTERPLLSRRAAGALALAAFYPAIADASPHTDLTGRIAALEREAGGRLGVAAINLQTGVRLLHRADERFAMCSTFKFLLAAAILAHIDRGRDTLDARIIVTSADLLSHSPAAEKHLGPPGMTISALCDAIVTQSDNGAANLLLKRIGGPAALTAWLRTQGDSVTRLDRYELDLNKVAAGDERDTTTPAAMLADLRNIVLGNILSPASRQLVTGWLVANTTGNTRLRAGIPAGWRVGDKTGTGPTMNNAVNDLAIIWPPHRAPLLVAAYFSGSSAPDDRRERVLAQVGSVVAGL
jgi:beta-lactamase class A